VPPRVHTITLAQALLQPAGTWTPIDALQLHASLWTGLVVPAFDCHMLPLAGTRQLLESVSDASVAETPPPASPLSPLASTTSALAAAATMVFTREDVRSEHASDVHFHSPWALGGVSRLQCYIHALTCSVVAAQATMQQLQKEIEGHAKAASDSISLSDKNILFAHRVETGDSTMVLQSKI
jgi:hypothetical protein